jgi:hypothetical protein
MARGLATRATTSIVNPGGSLIECNGSASCARVGTLAAATSAAMTTAGATRQDRTRRGRFPVGTPSSLIRFASRSSIIGARHRLTGLN